MGSQRLTTLAAPTTNGDAVRATTKITEVNLESAVDLKHAAVTVSAPINLSTQAISLVNNAVSPATVTAIDIGALANSDTVIPTSKAVTTAIAAGGGGVTIYWQILAAESVTVAARTQYPVFHMLDHRGTMTLAAGAELIVHS
jgi:hypothetical protein